MKTSDEWLPLGLISFNPHPYGTTGLWRNFHFLLAFYFFICYFMRTLCERSVAQSGSAFGSGPKGQGFKSLRSDH